MLVRAISILECIFKTIFFSLFLLPTYESKIKTAFIPENYESCELPTGGSSYCVPAKECKELQILFHSMKKPLPIDIKDFISTSFSCRKQSDEDHVCCPFEDRSIILDGPRFKETGTSFFYYCCYGTFLADIHLSNIEF